MSSAASVPQSGQPLTLFAPAKINLFLHVTGRRPDGYHLLESVFSLIDWSDTIRLTKTSGPDLIREGDRLGEDAMDLAVRAGRALQAHPAWERAGRPGAIIEIQKQLPAGAGLGGGSSDAASTLLGLNRLWGLGLSREALAEIGLSLGADVPFFVFGETAFAKGIGEDLVPFALVPRWVLIAVPRTPVSTAAIFQDPELTRHSKPLKIADFAQAASDPIWRFGHNDLEPVTRRHFEDVDQVLKWLTATAVSEGIAPEAVRMSGSGGAVFCTAVDQSQAERMLHQMTSYQQSTAGQCLSRLQVCKTLAVHPERPAG
jgi:4-diphosphocytidyl-2-C-methyl-D-erythritol kinase